MKTFFKFFTVALLVTNATAIFAEDNSWVFNTNTYPALHPPEPAKSPSMKVDLDYNPLKKFCDDECFKDYKKIDEASEKILKSNLLVYEKILKIKDDTSSVEAEKLKAEYYSNQMAYLEARLQMEKIKMHLGSKEYKKVAASADKCIAEKNAVMVNNSSRSFMSDIKSFFSFERNGPPAPVEDRSSVAK